MKSRLSTFLLWCWYYKNMLVVALVGILVGGLNIWIMYEASVALDARMSLAKQRVVCVTNRVGNCGRCHQVSNDKCTYAIGRYSLRICR